MVGYCLVLPPSALDVSRAWRMRRVSTRQRQWSRSGPALTKHAYLDKNRLIVGLDYSLRSLTALGIE